VGFYLSRPENTLRNNSAARHLTRLGYEQDIDFCLAENTVLVVPRLSDGAFTTVCGRELSTGPNQ
jgi:phosphosulfolactate phosphohydrolase-like enzyme